MGQLNIIENLIKKEKGYDAIVKKFGSIENALKAINEEDVLKFYYCESEDKFLVGQRVDTRYYAEVCKTGLSFRWSRYLPWGEHVVAPNTVWKEHTYPSEPKEIDFFDWLQGYIKQIDKEEANDIKTNGDRIRNMTDEELAWFLCKVKADYQWVDQEYPNEENGGEWEEWLQKEVE